jgi:MAF protein
MLLLASNSPRRRQLLALGGWTFHMQATEVDERPQTEEHPGDYVLRLAEGKARAAAHLAESGDLVIAADTTVADGMTILGKPADASQAAEMLTRLRGRVHRVYTAVAVFCPEDGVLLTDLCVTDVPMRNYSDEELHAYVASGDPLDKAGAYAIQHAGFHPVDRLEGCYANVVGLPLCHLTRTLRKTGVLPNSDVPRGCQEMLGYHCPIFEQILA